MGTYLLKVNNRNSKTWCKICLKLTIKTAERYQVISLRCVSCKFYTHFATYLAFVLLTLNMQLFAGQLSSFCEDMWLIHIEVVMLIFFEKKFHCRFELSFVTYNNCLCETTVKELFVVKLENKSYKFTKKLTFYYFFKTMYTPPNNGYFYPNRYGSRQRMVLEKIENCFYILNTLS